MVRRATETAGNKNRLCGGLCCLPPPPSPFAYGETRATHNRDPMRTRPRNFYLPPTERIKNARCAREGFKGFKTGRPLPSALIEISLSRFYYLGMDAVAQPRRNPLALRINLPVFVVAIKGYITRRVRSMKHVRRTIL